MRISSIEIENIGVFENLQLTFPEKKEKDKAEIHIFTGKNGTGKSTLLHSLAAFLSIEKNQLNNRCDNLKKSSLKIYYSYKNLIANTFRNPSEPVPILSKESEFLHKIMTILQLSNFEAQRKYILDFAVFSYSGIRNVQNVQIHNAIQNQYDSLYNYQSLSFQSSVNINVFVQWLANTLTKEALEKLNGNIDKANRYRSSITQIENIIEKVVGKEIKILLITEPLSIRVLYDGVDCSIDALPDGIKSILSWIGDLMMKLDSLNWKNNTPLLERNFILFLDEIEVHLHPAWQRKILPVVQKLFPNAQIFISTHSPFVVGSVDGANVYRFELNEKGKSILAKQTISNTAQSYALITEEIFEIEENFGDSVENELDKFYEIKEELLSKNFSREHEFEKLTKNLLEKGMEIRTMIGSEIRQLNRQLNKNYVL
jgi:predicted ATP-binding protein involved in virulence